MSTNKNASFRYRVLDQCFQNRYRQWTLQALIQKVSEELKEHHNIGKGVSKRQIQEDIRIMRSEAPLGYDAPINCKNGCYSYTDSTFSIEKKALNTQDISHLNEALRLLRQFRGVPHFRDIERIILKMEGKVRYNDPEEEIIAFEQIDLVKGHEFIPILYESIREQQSLIIEYQSFQAKAPLPLESHPYYLKEYRGRWYIFGWVTEWDKVTNLALDRVIKVTPCEKQCRSNADFDPVAYFKQIVGVTLWEEGLLQTVKIRVDAVSAPYIRTKLIHPSQKEEMSIGDRSIFTFELIPNFEFEAELLRLGEAVEVMEPDDFRNKIMRRLASALKGYENVVE